MTADLTALAEALADLQATFEGAARERLALIRQVAAAEVGPDGTATQQALVAALVRREHADADETASPADRVARVIAEAHAADQARGRLAPHTEIQRLTGEIDATWTAALARSDAIAGWLAERAEPPVATAFADYVEALRALHALGPGAEPAAVEAAIAAFTTALATLERTAGAPPA